MALFGRDTLMCARQAALAGPELLAGTVAVLAQWVGTENDAWRDERPGRILHEAHASPRAIAQLLPRDRYYGSMNASALYAVALAELWAGSTRSSGCPTRARR